jgi:hypothetical protein
MFPVANLPNIVCLYNRSVAKGITTFIISLLQTDVTIHVTLIMLVIK